LESGLRVSFQVGWIAKEQNLDAASSGGQFAGGNEAIAAVIPFAAEDDDVRAIGKLPQHKTSYGRTGVAHQVDRGNAIALGRHAIDGAHFVGGQNFHVNQTMVVEGRGSAWRWWSQTHARHPESVISYQTEPPHPLIPHHK